MGSRKKKQPNEKPVPEFRAYGFYTTFDLKTLENAGPLDVQLYQINRDRYGCITNVLIHHSRGISKYDSYQVAKGFVRLTPSRGDAIELPHLLPYLIKKFTSNHNSNF